MLRSSLYKAARVLGDINAIKRGKLPQRIIRKVVYRKVNGWLARIFR